MYLIHAVNLYDATDPDTRRRHAFAARTWDRVYGRRAGRETRYDLEGKVCADADCLLLPVPHLLDRGTRSSADIGDKRALPYLKDVVNHAVNAAEDGDGILLTNADTCLPREAPTVVKALLGRAPCWYSRRAEIPYKLTEPLTMPALRALGCYPGADLFAFRVDWWVGQEDSFPDVFYGAEGWDGALKLLMETDNPAACVPMPLCYHERHAAEWSKPGMLGVAPAERHNRLLLTHWAKHHGHTDRLNAGQFLFK